MSALPASWMGCPCGRRAPVVGSLGGATLDRSGLLKRLQDAPRPGVSREQRCQIAALAFEAPAQTERLISRWTGREIADELKVRGIMEQISPWYAARLLKKGAFNRTASGTG